MIVKLVSLITAVVLGVPISGVYASADTPSKYLDRMTLSNSASVGTNDTGDGSDGEGMTAPTVSKAVKSGHGIVLNTVDRNSDRMEYVNNGFGDRGGDNSSDNDGTSHPAVNVSNTDDAVMRPVVDDSDSNDNGVVGVMSQAEGDGLAWPDGGFTGETTVTYDANGKGTFADGTTTNAVTTKYTGYMKPMDVTEYAHTDNVDDAGVQNGGYGYYKSYSRVVTIPGASSLTVDLTYQTEGKESDWVCAYAGGTESSPVGDAQCSTAGSLTGKLGGTKKTTKSFTVHDDSVTFWFRSDDINSNYYGYYAVVRGMSGSKENVSGAYAAPVDPSDEYGFVGWNTKPDGTGENLGAGEVYLPSSQTVYAQWGISSSYTKWNTVGWRITDDGVLKLRPWEGDTGTTGSVTSLYNAPWYSKAPKIRKVESTGNIVLNANSIGLFYNCSNLTDISSLASWNVSNVTSMSYMFNDCRNLTNLSPLEDWNVSNVTDMNCMFLGCSSLTDLSPLASWNVSNVTSMLYMFQNCSNLTDLSGLADWNVSKVTSMSSMFSGCSKLTDLIPLANWNVSKVMTMDYMFSNCSRLTDLSPLEGWDVSNVKNMSDMFFRCSKLTDLTPLSSWNVSNVMRMDYMFSSCSNLADLTPLASWNVSNVINMQSTFNSCSNLTNIYALASWDVTNVTNMRSMFQFCSNLTDITPLESWNVSKVTSMSNMFDACSNLTDLTALAYWNVSKVTSMSNMFCRLSNLTDLTPLADWNVSKVTSMSSMFSGCSKLTDLSALSSWDVSNVTTMIYMFYGCSNLTDISALANWNVSNVTDMSYLFRDCSKLTDLTPLSSWNVSNVTNIGGMFYDCSNLTNLTPLASWNVSKVRNMDYVLTGCSNLTDISALSSWDVSNVTRMGYMFYNCSNITDLTALADWDVSKVTDMYGMFRNCSKIREVGIPSIANGGQNLVNNASSAWLTNYMPTIITEDFTMGPYTWPQLKSEMQTNPDAFQEGTIWVKYTPSWIVTYNANGGVGSMPGTMTPVGQPLTLPEVSYLRFGYKFTGWTTQSDSVSDANPLLKVGETYHPSDAVAGKKYTLYAQWEKLGDTGDQPTTGQSGMLPGWIQVDSDNTKADIIPNQSQNVTFTNKYDPGSTSIQFKFTKLMNGNVPDAGEAFQFELIDITQNKAIQTTSNTGASVQFQPIVYDKGGVYTYYVRETPSNVSANTNSNPNLDYDDHLVEVVVTVTEEDDPTSPSGRKLKATAQITGDTTFRNNSKPASLDITKDVTGVTDGMSETHKDREFTFNVNLLDRDNQPVTGKTYPTTTTNNGESSESSGNASSSTGSITFDATGNATVKLKADSKLTINGIPAYYKYTITETNIPAGYENTSLTNSSGILGANSHVTVVAVNHYTVTPANASLQAGKTLLAPSGLNQAVENGEFRFTLCQVVTSSNGTEPKSEAEAKAKAKAEPDAESCTGVSEAFNDGNGLITFPQLTYEAPGTYQYQIREVKGNSLNMTYDSTVYTVTVKVTDNGEGRLVATVSYRNNTTGLESSPVSSPVWDPSDPNVMGIPVFVNRTTVANRLPVTGGRDIIIASVILALILAGDLFVFARRKQD